LSSFNTVSGNNIANNGYGIFLWSSNHKIHHNNFIYNTNQAGSFESNTWDDGYPSGGNYWSDYEERYPNATEIDDSGIWDTPYVIDENNQDNYPLMNPWTPQYTLTIYSSPTGVTCTVEGISRTASWSGTYIEGTSVSLVMPETHDGHVWSHWLEDGDTNRIKTVTMDTDISLTAVFTQDTMPPTISMLSPENETYSASDVPLTFTLSELTSWIGYSLDGQHNVTISGNTTLTGLSDGTHWLIVHASDMTGNEGSSEMVYFTIQSPVIDTTPPEILVKSPENKTYTTADISLICTVDESVSWMGYNLDGQANTTITGNTYLSGLSDGSHSLIVYAKDTAGNTGVSEMVYFSITTLQPESFPWWVLGAVAGMAVIGIALGTFFLRKRRSVKS